MRKSKCTKLLVFSVYSHELENYPYLPFLADSISDAIAKYIRFIDKRNSICAGAELHWIGTCEQYYDSGTSNEATLENIQPLMVPQRVTFKRDLFGRIVSKVFVLGVIYRDRVVNYLSSLFERKEKV